MTPTIRVMRLWRSGNATPIYHGLCLLSALRWLEKIRGDGRVWIELEKQPAVELDSLWRPKPWL